VLCGVDFELLEPEDFRPHLQEIARRIQMATQ
jgi:hypothetical protein